MNQRLVILFLFVFSLFLRAYAGFHGSPFCYHVDEHWMFEPAFYMDSHHTWDLHWFRVPPFLILAYRMVILLLQQVAPIDLNLPEETWFDNMAIMPHQFPVLYVGRLLVALFGSGTVIMIYLTMRKVVKENLAFLFALFYSIFSVSILFSSYLRPESVVEFFLVLSLYFLCNFQVSQKKRWLVFAGVVFGFSCATKYNASFFLVSAVLFLCLIRTSWRSFFRDSAIYGSASGVGFLMGNPYILWKYSSVGNDIIADYHTYKAGQSGNMGSHFENFLYYINNLGSFDKAGLIFWQFVLILCIAVYTYKKIDLRIRPLLIILVFFPVSYIVFLCQFNYRAERNLIFINPFLFMAVCFFTSKLLASSKKWITSATYLILFATLFQLSYSSVDWLNKYNQPLPQDNVRQWISQHADPGTTIIREFRSPLLDPSRYRVLYTFSAAVIRPDVLLALNPKYLVLAEFIYSITPDFRNEYPKKFGKWIWSKTPEFEDDNSRGIPLGTHFRIYDFEKIKKEFIENFHDEIEELKVQTNSIY